MRGHLVSYAQKYVDAGNAGHDHIPQAVDVKILISRKQTTPAFERFDRDLLQKCDQSKLEKLFCHPPEIKWVTDVDSHATQLSEWVSDVLLQSFPMTGNKPRKGYIRDDTWALRARRLSVRGELRKWKNVLAVMSTQWAWRCWKSTDS